MGSLASFGKPAKQPVVRLPFQELARIGEMDNARQQSALGQAMKGANVGDENVLVGDYGDMSSERKDHMEALNSTISSANGQYATPQFRNSMSSVQSKYMDTPGAFYRKKNLDAVTAHAKKAFDDKIQPWNDESHFKAMDWLEGRKKTYNEETGNYNLFRNGKIFEETDYMEHINGVAKDIQARVRGGEFYADESGQYKGGVYKHGYNTKLLNEDMVTDALNNYWTGMRHTPQGQEITRMANHESQKRKRYLESIGEEYNHKEDGVTDIDLYKDLVTASAGIYGTVDEQTTSIAHDKGLSDEYAEKETVQVTGLTYASTPADLAKMLPSDLQKNDNGIEKLDGVFELRWGSEDVEDHNNDQESFNESAKMLKESIWTDFLAKSGDIDWKLDGTRSIHSVTNAGKSIRDIVSGNKVLAGDNLTKEQFMREDLFPIETVLGVVNANPDSFKGFNTGIFGGGDGGRRSSETVNIFAKRKALDKHSDTPLKDSEKSLINDAAAHGVELTGHNKIDYLNSLDWANSFLTKSRSNTGRRPVTQTAENRLDNEALDRIDAENLIVFDDEGVGNATQIKNILKDLGDNPDVDKVHVTATYGPSNQFFPAAREIKIDFKANVKKAAFKAIMPGNIDDIRTEYPSWKFHQAFNIPGKSVAYPLDADDYHSTLDAKMESGVEGRAKYFKKNRIPYFQTKAGEGGELLISFNGGEYEPTGTKTREGFVKYMAELGL
jgi:hypothetical protein